MKVCLRKYVSVISLLFLWTAMSAWANAADKPESSAIFKSGDKIAIVGDSITQQIKYSRFLELYLTACMPQYELKVVHPQINGSGLK
jgi:hypothetical protein